MLGDGLPSPGGKYVVALDKNRSVVRRLADGKVFSLARNGVYRPWSVWTPNESRLAVLYRTSSAEYDGQSVVDTEHYAAFGKLLDAENPDILFAQWPIDKHRDHRALSNLVLDAWLRI